MKKIKYNNCRNTNCFKHSSVLFFALILLFNACKKTDHVQNTPPGQGTGSVAGIVTDLNNTPVSNAKVTGGTATATTDANGKFTLAKVQFSSDTVLVNVTKDGFFEGSKNFASNNNSVNNAAIQLIPKPGSVTISASSGGNITVSGGGSINFASGFVNASNGNPYTGNVSVSTSYLNPTDQNFSAHVPGDLKSVSTSNQQGILQSFGVVVVEMSDASGNKLQLASGKTATITVPIPSALQSMAPSLIPLWYFDDTKGSWKQEGTATKQGSNYVGVVKHFSFWNAGDFASTVKLSATFIDSVSGKAVANKVVTLTRLGTGLDTTSTSGITDTTGTVSGFVPVNESLNMKVVNNCGVVLYSQNIGPFSMDTVFGKISIRDSICIPPVQDTTQYIKLTLFGGNYSWNYSTISEFKTDSISYYSIGIVGGSPSNTGDSSTYFLGNLEYITDASPSPGNYTFVLNTIINGSLNYTSYDYYYPNNKTYSNVTKFDAVGGYIEGTASGFLFKDIADSVAFSCSYRVKRTQ
jgi:hypothetical protein